MPTLEVNLKDLEKLAGKKLPKDLDETMMLVKGEIDGREKGILKIDLKETNRPDLWSSEGIARELKAKLGHEKGIPKYKVKKGKTEITIDKNMEEVRPFIACAVARNVKVTDDFIVQMVQLQEKVGITFGRKRKEVGIGLYDFDKIKPPLFYKGFKPREIEFTPLEFKREMDLDEILEMHPKGREFSHLVKGQQYYPIVIDSENVVASMPPIINSEATGKITEKTKNIFIECTGYNWEVVNIALKVMVMALADRKAKIESVKVNFPKGKKINYPKKSLHTPMFGEKKIMLNPKLARERMGLDLKDKELIGLLGKARYNARMKGRKIECSYGDYRNDILHEMDVIEDMLIAYGYNNIEPLPIEMPTIGYESRETKVIDCARDICIGMGLQEVLQYTLTSKEKQEKNMELKEEEFVELSNPMSETYAIFRKSLIPELLSFLSKNKNASLPQGIFEAGRVLEMDEKAENKVKERDVIAIAITKTQTNFTEIKSHLDAYCRSKGIEYSLEKTYNPSFIEGRVAEIKKGKKEIGRIGEVHPKVLNNFSLENPVVVFEIEI